MVYRVFVEKKPGLRHEAAALKADINGLLGIKGVTDVRIINRYDAENIDEELFDYARRTVFSEPQLDTVSDTLVTDGEKVFAVEYLPGQFDQRADSAAQCIQIISQKDRPTVKTAKVYAVRGDITEEELEKIKKYVINPVESRLASMELPQTLDTPYAPPAPVKILEGFTALDEEGLKEFVEKHSLAMDADDVRFCRDHFRKEGRDPTLTEIRMIDTYWSDHCRHTTFLTQIDEASFEDELTEKTWREYLQVRKELGRENKPVCLMDLATVAVKELKKKGLLDRLDESEEINACTVKADITVDGKKEKWLILFKNETHNHPTEIEPFGGAATCIGGAIRDPLSGRSYVYAAMRVTGAADPTLPLETTLPGKLPQRTIVTTAAAGYSSYGNQIGLATGSVSEIYHPGYAAKRMEIGAVIAAAPAANVRRERPAPGDVVILLGGATGRDGCGGATGSSKSHNAHSLETCGAEVQKGNAPEERKLQRLFRNEKACRMIKRCNDFGAGGVSVAVGELADGLDIDLDAVPKKYEGLDGTELAISESQERMAVVVADSDAEAFIALAKSENLRATKIASVTEDPRLVMRWRGNVIVDIPRDFLNSNGAPKHIKVSAPKPQSWAKKTPSGFAEGMKTLAGDLNVCSERGLAERFDSTIGAGTVLMPFGGKRQLTPIQAMVHKISVEKKHTEDCTAMAWGYDPFIAEKSPYHGAYDAVAESVSKLIAVGAGFDETYLSFQEYFERPGKDPKRWGKPLAALLGAFRAQRELGVGAIGGKDSMSGSFENLDVPPTLVSFAVTHCRCDDIICQEFQKPGSKVYIISPEYGSDGLPEASSLLKVFQKVTALIRSGKVLSCRTLTYGGAAEAVLKMCMGNGLGFGFAKDASLDGIFSYGCGSFVVEAEGELDEKLLGEVTLEPNLVFGGESVRLGEIEKIYEDRLESVYPCNIPAAKGKFETFSYRAASRPAPAVKCARPKVLIPAFPGTNCEYDSAKAFEDAGAETRIFVINNMDSDGISRSVEGFAGELKDSQIVFIPGGFSGGDEPEGSGKFITAFFRSASVKDAVTELLERRDGLMLGICNGFQALIKLGLVPYGRIIDTDESCPTLSFNVIARHQSKIVRTRVASNKSPWLKNVSVGDIISVPISHGEGRFIADEALIRKLAENGQIATQYVDDNGLATGEVRFNPNGSAFAIEGITSPDGRVLGKMGHSERTGYGLYRNVPGNYDLRLFKAAADYFKN